MAQGDLTAKVPVGAHDYPELVELSAAINSMGESLGRARHLEREFFLSVSHELRTPLTSIRGYADAIADGATDDVTAAVAIISAEARRLERLVQDLLDLARLDTKQFSMHVEPIDCVALVRPIVEGFRPQADRLGVALAPSFPPDGDLIVEGDADRLGQIVANLVENAFKYATTLVEVGITRVDRWILVWVADDGPGIAAGDLPHVFERHFTSDRLPARQIGSGLGLAIVSELATAMGAVVNADSPVEDGRGTRMSLWLPGTLASSPSPANERPSKRPSERHA
jgi:two-component system sensor histidine kinase BaeS